MPQTFSEGDTIQIVTREATATDVKSQLYYPHYSGLTGTLAKIYPDATATVTVTPDSLPQLIRTRHDAGTEAMRQKWLDGLSDEARNRLSAAEKKFGLRYTILISVNDIVGADVTSTKAIATQATLELDAPEPSRKSLSELEADELRHLDEVAKRNKDV